LFGELVLGGLRGKTSFSRAQEYYILAYATILQWHMLACFLFCSNSFKLSFYSRAKIVLRSVGFLPSDFPPLKGFTPEPATKKPLVSIYIPAYNAKEFIIQAIDSALAQTYPNIEVCVCDDWSTDKTFQLITSHYANNSRVKICRTRNKGISAASRAAVALSTGEYIGQLDADDVLLPNAVETLLPVLVSDRKAAFVYSSAYHVDARGGFLSVHTTYPWYSHDLLAYNMCIPHFRLFRVRALANTSGWDESLTSAVDYDLFIKLSNVGTAHFVNAFLYKYRVHGNNISIRQRKQQQRNLHRITNSNLRALQPTDN